MIWIVAIVTILLILAIGIIGGVVSSSSGDNAHHNSLISRFIDWMN